MRTEANSAGVPPLRTTGPREGRPVYRPEPAPALRCAVLAWAWSEETGDHSWVIIFANGDEGAARAKAAEWLERNPEGECQLMIAPPDCRARIVTKVEWK